MLLKAIEPICSDDTAVTLMERLAILGAVTMVKALRLMIAGSLPREPQDHAQATYAPKMQKADGQIDWSLPASLIERRTRAFEPWPGAFTVLPARAEKEAVPERIKILQAEVVRESVSGYEQAMPGTVCLITPVGPLVTTGDGLLCLTAVQPDGSRRMDGKSFLNGHPMEPGDRFRSVL